MMRKDLNSLNLTSYYFAVDAHLLITLDSYIYLITNIYLIYLDTYLCAVYRNCSWI